MSIKKIVKQIQKEANEVAEQYRVNYDTPEYRAGYADGVKAITRIIEVARTTTLLMAKDVKDDPLLYSVMKGYADSLKILVATGEMLTPPSDFEIDRG